MSSFSGLMKPSDLKKAGYRITFKEECFCNQFGIDNFQVLRVITPDGWEYHESFSIPDEWYSEEDLEENRVEKVKGIAYVLRKATEHFRRRECLTS